MFHWLLMCSVFLFKLQVARAGRFGTKGLGITFVSDETDAKVLNDVQERFEVNITELPEEIDVSSYCKCTESFPWKNNLKLRKTYFLLLIFLPNIPCPVTVDEGGFIYGIRSSPSGIIHYVLLASCL